MNFAKKELTTLSSCQPLDYIGRFVSSCFQYAIYSTGGNSSNKCSARTIRDKLVKIGAKVVSHSRYVIFQMAEVAVPRVLFREILDRIRRLRFLAIFVSPG